MTDLPFSDHFLSDVLPRLNDADLIKVMFFIQFRCDRQEGENHYLFIRQILESTTLQHWLGGTNIEERIKQSLKNALNNRLVLSGNHPSIPNATLIFPTDEAGQASLQRLIKGLWQPTPTDHMPETQTKPQKNIYQLYEENIGPLTPLLSEDLTAAQEEFPAQWIEEAFHIAVKNNARSWRYIDAVLKSWQKEGKNVQSRRDSETLESRRNKSSEFDDYVQH